MRLIKKPISLFLALIPLLIHGGILGKYYIESVVIDDEKNQWLQPQEKGWLAGDVGHSISIDRESNVIWESMCLHVEHICGTHFLLL